MNRHLAAAVIATLREDGDDSCFLIGEFNARDWIRNYKWLDASGLTLYFVAQIKSLQLEESIPVEIMKRFEQNLVDNKDRTREQFEEFIRINKLFQDNGLSYVNLKGFTLVPDACADASLRRQFDLDFAVTLRDALQCEQLLSRQGYWLTGTGKNVLEFKTGSGHLPSVRELYKAGLQCNLEIHFSSSADQKWTDSHEEAILRSELRKWNDKAFPVLCESDKFISLAKHLFKHLQGEWTRISWILEYASFVRFHRSNDKLWSDVYLQAENNDDIKNAIGAATLIASQSFGLSSVSEILSSTVEDLPSHIKLWIKRHTREVLFADFPGTKLYLFLKKSTVFDGLFDSNELHHNLFPVSLPPPVSYPMIGEGWISRAKKRFSEISYVCFRFKFHIKEGFRYAIEIPRWKRYISEQQRVQ